jgi:ADP-ribosylarginine hydrolase
MDVKERFKASMVLAGVGDALGYKNGAYEFCRIGQMINDDVKDSHGGVLNIRLDKKNWMISDDTVMTLASGDALVSEWKDKPELYTRFAEKYIDCMSDMVGRAPGNTCLTYTRRLRPKVPNGWIIPFNPVGGGCGAAMRASPIGLAYHRPEDIDDLIAVAIESGRMTHNHPTGYLGSLASALFVSYAVQRKPLVSWGAGLMAMLDKAWTYIEQEGRDVEENRREWYYFKDAWEKYLSDRGISDGSSKPQFPADYGPGERDKFYNSVSYSGWGGASGHDAPMIAYDALLSCGNSWEELCKRGMFHGGDSDSTGIIAGACWGAMNGFEGVPPSLYENAEYHHRLAALSEAIYDKFNSQK